MIVLDASVFIKLFREEDGTDAAHALLEHVYRSGTDIIAPGIMRYEVLGAAIHYGVPLETIAILLEDMQGGGFTFVEPTRAELILAEEIATTRVAGGGWPDLFDSIYHAIALSRSGTFVTADRRHVAKAGKWGSVVMLAEWNLG